MPYTTKTPFSKQVIIVAGLSVVGAMAFGLALSYYKNVLFDRRLDQMAEHNKRLHQENMARYVQLEYLQSAQYKDKYAKEHLNKVNPGENVIIIVRDPHASLADPTLEQDGIEREILYEKHLRSTPVIEHWRYYFFDRSRLEELKELL